MTGLQFVDIRLKEVRLLSANLIWRFEDHIKRSLRIQIFNFPEMSKYRHRCGPAYGNPYLGVWYTLPKPSKSATQLHGLNVPVATLAFIFLETLISSY